MHLWVCLCGSWRCGLGYCISPLSPVPMLSSFCFISWPPEIKQLWSLISFAMLFLTWSQTTVTWNRWNHEQKQFSFILCLLRFCKGTGKQTIHRTITLTVKCGTLRVNYCSANFRRILTKMLYTHLEVLIYFLC